MVQNKENYYDNLKLFFPYLKKVDVVNKLTFMQVFPDFEGIYTEIRLENEDDDTSIVIAKTLNKGLSDKKLNTEELDELLFLLLEDSLFNSYLFSLDSHNIDLSNKEKTTQVFQDWGLPDKNQIINNVKKTSHSKDFVLCGYRLQSNTRNKENIESIRIILLDKMPVQLSDRNGDIRESVYPTIVEIDISRNLLHIRLKDVDNIVNTEDKIRTMSGRITNTLKYIDSFNPHINYASFSTFRSSLYNMEENLLQEKRDQAFSKLKEFDTEINGFSEKVTKKFNPPEDIDISVKTYISNGVLSVIASTLSDSTIGDVVGIKFRDNQENENDKKYAEITISDKGYNCISTNNLYWLNLPVLHRRKMVEFLKITKNFNSGIVVANLEFSNETANVRLLQRTSYENAEHKKPSQQKYDDLINYLCNFL
ncbi:hypothetical protein [Salimicrobium album]|uniref:Uncharacterized protein n=1 Tax=Salimicrobium album TaxID=50717 RepID=A0A1H3D9D4_9BACI|nr:hypothetical protein [Salimicrobium album]SDX62344.1 hypothetical protein SAMN04488081_0860 [Salimicrobium album]